MNDLYTPNGDLDAVGVKDKLSVFSELALQNTDVTIDMSAVQSIDGSGIGALVFLYKRLRSTGHRVRLTNVRSQPMSVLENLGLAEIFSANRYSAYTGELTADKITEHVTEAGSEPTPIQSTT